MERYPCPNCGRKLEAENERFRAALRQYADRKNWGYYDSSGCMKGFASYTEACFIGPEVAEKALEGGK